MLREVPDGVEHHGNVVETEDHVGGVLDSGPADGGETVVVVGDRESVPHGRGGDGFLGVYELVEQLLARERRKGPERAGVDGDGDRVCGG